MVLRKIKSPYCIIIFLIMLIIFLLSNNSCNPTTGTVKTRPLWLQPPVRDFFTDELKNLLARTSMEDMKVIVTMVGQEWASSGSILDLFLESFRNGQGTKPLLNHLLIVALDNKAFGYCKSVHPHCFYLSNSSIRQARNNQLSVPLLKNNFWIEVTELGYSFVYTDADVMWLRNPIPQVDGLKPITVACDVHPGDLQSINNIMDGGFFYVRSNRVTSKYFKYRELRRILYTNSQDRSLCEETVVNRELFKMLELRFMYMERNLYGGFCQQNINTSTIHTLRANCCDDTESKVYDLKLLLEDWKNFTKKISVEGWSSPFTWRAPSKCKG